MFISDSFAAAYGNTLAVLLIIATCLISIFVRAVGYHIKKLDVNLPTHAYDIVLAPVVTAFVMFVILTGSKAVALEMYCIVFVFNVLALMITFIGYVHYMQQTFKQRDAKDSIRRIFGGK